MYLVVPDQFKLTTYSWEIMKKEENLHLVNGKESLEVSKVWLLAKSLVHPYHSVLFLSFGSGWPSVVIVSPSIHGLSHSFQNVIIYSIHNLFSATKCKYLLELSLLCCLTLQPENKILLYFQDPCREWHGHVYEGIHSETSKKNLSLYRSLTHVGPKTHLQLLFCVSTTLAT